MNKKFSTLMAGLLLAGGMFSTAEASNWTTDTRYVQDSGKYFVISKTGDSDLTTWTGVNDGYFLVLDGAGKPIWTNDSSKKDYGAYWRLIKRTNPAKKKMMF